ncbi:MAG: hypothetical protein PHQ75_13900, partial [Thermoguttaceae bacterium]|nr:hypothetical protein [Thermoguttaceae bacterium]
TYAELLLNGKFITLTDEILNETSALLETFCLSAPENDEEKQRKSQLTRIWNAGPDSAPSPTAASPDVVPIDLQRRRNCQKDWYRIIQCFKVLLDNIAIGEIQLLETCYDSCRDMLLLDEMKNSRLAQDFYKAVRSSLVSSQKKYDPGTSPDTLLNKTDSVARGLKNILPGVAERLTFPIRKAHISVLSAAIILKNKKGRVASEANKTVSTGRRAAETLLKKRRIIYERFQCVILCLDAFACRFLSDHHDSGDDKNEGRDCSRKKINTMSIANPVGPIQELILLIIKNCSKAYELVEWHLTELITAYLWCKQQPDELCAACSTVMEWVDMLNSREPDADQFAVRHVICKILARVNDILVKALDERTRQESTCTDFVDQVGELFKKIRLWYQLNKEFEDVPQSASFVRLAYAQIKCACCHEALRPSVERLSDLEVEANILASHGYSECEQIASDIRKLSRAESAASADTKDCDKPRT